MFIDDLENGQGQWLLHLRAILFNKAQECWLKSRYKVFSSRWHSFSDKTKKNKSTYLNLFFLFMYNKPFKKIVVNGKSDLICYWKTLHTYKHFWKKLMKNLAWFSYKVIVIFFFVMTSTHVFNYSCRYICYCYFINGNKKLLYHFIFSTFHLHLYKNKCSYLRQLI